jgi:hypothetical protein
MSDITDIGFLAVNHSGHQGSADDGMETAWSIISSDTSFALKGTVIYNNCSLIFSHVSK